MQVFTQKKQTRFVPKYIAFFYQILEAGLKDDALRPVCIVGCRGLLQARTLSLCTAACLWLDMWRLIDFATLDLDTEHHSSGYLYLLRFATHI